MSDYDDLDMLIKERQAQVMALSQSHISVVRQYFEKLEKLLGFYKHNKALAQVTGKTGIGEVSEFLHGKGVCDEAGNALSGNAISTLLSRVRAERGTRKGRKSLEAAPAQAVTLTAPVRAKAPARGVTLTPVPRAASPVLVIDQAPAVAPVEVTDWVKELTRLEQSKGGAWTGADEWMWSYFVGKAASIGARLPKDFVTVERLVADPIKNEVMGYLIAKARAVRPALLQ